MRKIYLSDKEKNKILEMHYKAMDKSLILEQNESNVVVEIGTWTTTEVDGKPEEYCAPVMVKGSFSVSNTTENIKQMSDAFVKAVQAEINKNDILKKSQEDKSLKVTSLSIIGGASNFFNSVPTPYEIDNNFYDLKDNTVTIKTPSADETKTFTKDENIIKGNKQLSVDRANNMFNGLKQFSFNELQIMQNYKEEPKVEGYIVDTGGVIDEVNEKQGKDLNPGQIVKVYMMLCGIKIPKDTVKSCFAGITIDVRYDRENDELNKDDKGEKYNHWCNNASYVITGNDIQLYGDEGEAYANLNNKWYDPDFQPINDRGKIFPEYVNWNLRPFLPKNWPDGKRISNERLKKMNRSRTVAVTQTPGDGSNPQDRYMTLGEFLEKRQLYLSKDPYFGRGGSRNTSFTISPMTAEKFVNADKLEKYKGNLSLKAYCVNPGGFKDWGGGCHPGAARIIVKDNEGTVLADVVGKTPMQLNAGIELVKVAACTPEKL